MAVPEVHRQRALPPNILYPVRTFNGTMRSHDGLSREYILVLKAHSEFYAKSRSHDGLFREHILVLKALGELCAKCSAVKKRFIKP
jgi:hypothetical protein